MVPPSLQAGARRPQPGADPVQHRGRVRDRVPFVPSMSSTSSTAVPSASFSAARAASWDWIAQRSTNTDTLARSTHGSNGLVR